MLKIKLIFLLAVIQCFLPFFSIAQQWMVYFKDKQHDGYNPYEYFDAKAIERRIRNGIPVDDPSDWPVNEKYVEGISPAVNQVLIISRWFNAVAVEADLAQMDFIRQQPYVLYVEELEPRQMLPASFNEYDTILSYDQASVLKGQLQTLGFDEWKKAGIDGKGIRIAIFDVGFDHADKVPAFDHIRSDKRLIATHDFTNRKNNDYVFYGNGHGTQVWSCIGGKIGNTQIGLATGAEFLLAKTEKNSEKFSEELYWLAAAEWADKNGADIINSSLGYTGKRYFNWQMDGKTSFVTRAANIAARKGMLVVNAAGNEGSEEWHYIGAPADADSALSVGGINPETGYHTNFSSFGPTTDKRMKPNVSAYGHVVAAAPAGLVSTQGTSFAAPLVSGFAACAWQTNRSLSNMSLFKELEQSGNLYPYFDYAHGYGIPQADFFLNKDKLPVEPTFKVIENGDSLIIVVNKEFEEFEFQTESFGGENAEDYNYGMQENGDSLLSDTDFISIYPPAIGETGADTAIEINQEVLLNGDSLVNDQAVFVDTESLSLDIGQDTIMEYTLTNSESLDSLYFDSSSFVNTEPQSPEYEYETKDYYSPEAPETKEYLYYNIMNKNGVLDKYFVLDVTKPEVLIILKSDFRNGETLNVHFAGYSYSVKL